jgi:hypothetical protein
MHAAKTRLPTILVVLSILLFACAPSFEPNLYTQREADLQGTIAALEVESQASEASRLEAAFPFEGFWVSESDDPGMSAQILVITKDSFYELQTYDASAPNLPVSAHEMFADIVSVDSESNHIILRTKWFRTNGQFGGFGNPTATVTYAVENDLIRIGLLRIDDTQFPETPDSEPYYRK